MNLYLVSRCGVHIRDIIAVLDDMEKAIGVALSAMNGEPDDHHDMEVVELELNVLREKLDGSAGKLVATVVRYDNKPAIPHLQNEVEYPPEYAGLHVIEGGKEAFSAFRRKVNEAMEKEKEE